MTIHQAEDKLFKKALEITEVVRVFLEAHLPEGLLAQIDLDTLELQKNTFIDEAYKATEADVIYSVALRGMRGYIFILLEHQSSVDPWLAFRILVYTVRLMEHHRRQYPKEPLPVVYPLVVYNGKRVWHATKDLFKLFGKQEELARKLFCQPFALLDLNRRRYEELKRHPVSGLLEFALQFRQYREELFIFCERLLAWLDTLSDQTELTGFRTILLNYLLREVEGDELSLHVHQVSETLSEKLRSELMTFEQQIRQEALQLGLMQGLERGLEQGLERGAKRRAIEIARHMLTNGINRTDVKRMTQLSDEDLVNLI